MDIHIIAGVITMTGKGSGRRKEDRKKVSDNWDRIFKKKHPASAPHGWYPSKADYPLLCLGGNHHSFDDTGEAVKTWVSPTSSGEAPEDAPVMRNQKCWRCGAERMTY